MRLKQTRSAGEGLEQPCREPGREWIASVGPVDGVELFRAWFAGEAYRKHRHDTYAVGVTDSGVQVFDYRGAVHASSPGQVVVLYPDELHDGRAGTPDDLARQFRIALGTSPHRYLFMRRLQHAREAIHEARPLVQVACDAGFADQAHFTRAFKGAFGLTPGRYRALRRALPAGRGSW